MAGSQKTSRWSSVGSDMCILGGTCTTTGRTASRAHTSSVPRAARSWEAACPTGSYLTRVARFQKPNELINAYNRHAARRLWNPDDVDMLLKVIARASEH